jgi:hypothetical protein
MRLWSRWREAWSKAEGRESPASRYHMMGSKPRLRVFISSRFWNLDYWGGWNIVAKITSCIPALLIFHTRQGMQDLRQPISCPIVRERRKHHAESRPEQEAAFTDLQLDHFKNAFSNTAVDVDFGAYERVKTGRPRWPPKGTINRPSSNFQNTC